MGAMHMQCTHTTSHTGPPSLTIPWSRITLGCLNWAIMAASCRNLTLSSSLWDLVGSRTLIATSHSPFGDFHFPLWTPPNCPCPNADFVLKEWSILMRSMQISYHVIHSFVSKYMYFHLLCMDQAYNGTHMHLTDVHQKGIYMYSK